MSVERLAAAVAVVLLVVEVAFIQSRATFLIAATTTSLGALAAIYAIRRGESLKELIYSGGIIATAAGYCYLAIAPSRLTESGDEVIYWGIIDKRPLAFGYLAVVAFIAFHWCVVAFSGQAARTVVRGEASPRRWLGSLAGAMVVALLAFCWLGLPLLLQVNVVEPGALARYFDVHQHVHLASMEQIRLGATPYLEAQTQYGVGNQVLMTYLTNLVHYSNHGFFAANMALNAVCIVVFFVVVQQLLGLGWAVAGLVGWVLWPSPGSIGYLAGWAVLTRWIVIPLLALLLAYLLLGRRVREPEWPAMVFAGVIWGVGGFLSQESFTGGFMVAALSLALFGPISGRGPRDLAILSGLFLVSGIIVFVALVAGFVGPSRLFEVMSLASTKSALVMAGVSNSIWSDNLGVSAALEIIHGRLYTQFGAKGEMRAFLLTYGGALLLMLAVGLLAAFLGRRWKDAIERDSQFVWKFGGVVVGAYVMHLFTLLRSDTTHLSGPSFLLPLFLVMLPWFASRCIASKPLRIAVLLVSVGIIAESLVAGRSDLVRRGTALVNVVEDASEVLRTYRELRSFRGQEPDFAARYSPIERHQAGFTRHADYEEALELFDLLKARLRGRRVEMGFHRFDDLIGQPDSFYFFGGLRSVSGITSPMTSIWLRSEETAWIRKLSSLPGACIFFEPDAKSRLLEAWTKSARQIEKIVVEEIRGKRLYGTLACKEPF
jgi:hypothetical protein